MLLRAKSYNSHCTFAGSCPMLCPAHGRLHKECREWQPREAQGWRTSGGSCFGMLAAFFSVWDRSDDQGLLARLLCVVQTPFAPAGDVLYVDDASAYTWGPGRADCDHQCQGHCGDLPQRFFPPWVAAELCCWEVRMFGGSARQRLPKLCVSRFLWPTRRYSLTRTRMRVVDACTWEALWLRAVPNVVSCKPGSKP